MNKKRISIFISLLFISLFFSGCSNNKPPEVITDTGTVTEYFSESELELPEIVTSVHDFRITKDSSFLLIGDTLNGNWGLWTSKDGYSWEEKTPTFPQELSQSFVFSSIFIDDEQILLEATNSSPENARYYSVTSDGVCETKSFGTEENSISKFQISGTTLYAINPSQQISSYDYKTGQKLLDYNQSDMAVNDFCVLDNQILVLGADGVEMYDTVSGNPINIDVKLRDDLNEKLIYNSSNISIQKLAYNPENSTLYYTSSKGLQTYNFKTKTLQTALSSKAHKYFTSQKIIKTLVAYSDKLYLSCSNNAISFPNASISNALLVYTPKPNGIEITLSDRALKLYSLHQDSTFAELADNFNSSHNGVSIEYIWGTDDIDAITTQDAINQLSLELLEGSGPDIIILDGLRYRNLANREILYNLSDIAENNQIVNNIASPYSINRNTYGIPLYYKLLGIHADKEVIKNISTIEDLISGLEKQKQIHSDTPILAKWYEYSYVDTLYHIYGENLFDEMQLNQNKLKTFYLQLEKLNKLGGPLATAPSDSHCHFSYLLTDGLQLQDVYTQIDESRTSIGGILSPEDYSITKSYKGKNTLDFAFFKQKEQAVCIPNTVLAINANGIYPDEAKEFINYCLSEESYNKIADTRHGLPANLNALKQMMLHTNRPQLVTDCNGKDQKIKIKKISKKEKQEFYDVVENMVPSSMLDTTVEHFIMDEAEKYINKEQSLDKAVTTAVEKVNLYLAE